ncbi:phage portal protein [Psychrobacter namhaensis]|uniref:phage portal protein n=1 Tax=Psychrobacter namhaensis TaxID=292734 RepID=UPI003D0245B3
MGKFIDWMTGKKSANTAQPVHGGDVWHTIHDPTTGAWQRNQEIEVSKNDQMRHHAVFACMSLITRDIGKLKIKTKKKVNGVSQETNSRVKKLLAKPNHYQNTQQFFEAWASQKTAHGNTYVWKVRDIYGDIWRLLILDSERTKPLVDPNGNVFYQVRRNRLFDLDTDIIIPSSEIIHDRFNCFYHPLVGLSPITACALSASQGVSIQRNANTFFANASRPSGILVAPGDISEDQAKKMKKGWRENYTGTGTGDTAVLSGGVTYQAISVAAQDAQLVEQLKLSGEIICTAFSMPAFKVGLAPPPAGKISDYNDIYYSDCLQHYLESIENLLNEHLDLESGVETEFCLDGLLRMDAASQMDNLTKGVKGSIFAPNEARAKLGYAAVPGGESPMIQQQNFSLAAIAKRDASDNPFAKTPAANDDPQGGDDAMDNT